jgi:hypothetical protein
VGQDRLRRRHGASQRATGHRYRGINLFVLGMSPLAFASNDPRWCTYCLAGARGWQVCKGEKATPVYFYKPIEIEDQTSDGGQETRRIPMLRTFSVFHASQIDGIPELAPAVATKAVAERMVRANGANTNAEIHAPLSSHPQVRRSRFNAPFPAAVGGMRCALARGPAEGTRDEQRGGQARAAGAARASPARILRRGCDARSRVASAPTDRARIPANPDSARTPHTACQRSASPRTTRKDFW